MADKPIRNIVIAGGGTAGWMAAASLARFGAGTHEITLVESDAIGTIGVGEATIPQIHLFNQALQIDERAFLKATQGTIKLGIEFDGWTKAGHRYMHAFGTVGRGLGIVPFHHFWLRANELGLARPFGTYSFNETAARSGRMGPGDGRPGAIPNLTYAYHFDASLFAAMLRDYAVNLAVTRVEGRIESVERTANGEIAALKLDGDRRIDGDLFIDCTGFRSLLVGEALGSRFIDWSRYLPCDRAVAVPCERSDAFRPYTQSIARSAGWQWRIPLQHRTGNGHVYCSAFMTDEEAADCLLANLDGKAAREPLQLRFTAGMREKAWAGNCIALGLAAGFMEPLESTSIHLVQSGIARLLKYLPRYRIDGHARDEFNRLTIFEWERIRDLLVLHYVANGRVGEPFWDAARKIEIPGSLAEKLATWRGGARLHREHEELFTEEGWTQVLIGQNEIPRDWHPFADQVSRTDLADYLNSIAEGCARKAAALPTHDQFVREMVAV